MIYTLLYHHAKNHRYGNNPEMLDRHFSYIAKNYPSVHPGEMPKKHGVCLTFDDAYDDFPIDLIDKYRLKAVIAVPTALVGAPGYLTWDKIAELGQNPLIQLASHSHNHTDLSLSSNLDKEVVYSKSLLERYADVNTFIFPYGKYSSEALLLAKKHYQYVMRIGTAFNKSWNEPLIYRIPCDQLHNHSYPFNNKEYVKFFFKRMVNLALGK